MAAVNADGTYTVQAQTKVPRSAANPDGWQKVRVTKAADELTAGIANRGLTNAERKAMDDNKKSWSKAISNTSDDTLNALDEIASGNDFGIIHNKEYGNIRYNIGSIGKGGMGLAHIVESRMSKDGDTIEGAIEIAIAVANAAENGVVTNERYNTKHFDKDGVRAIVAFDSEGNKIITGYEISADAAEGANRRSSAGSSRSHVSLDEIISALKKSIADIRNARKAVWSNTVTPDEDAAYVDAVKRGDMETAHRMVREAAAKAMPNTKVVDKDGLPLVVYHGSEDFDPINGYDHVFDNQKYDGPRQIGADKGYFFTSDYKVASRFGKNGNNRYVPNWKELLAGTSFNNEKEYEEFGRKLSMTSTPQTDKSFFDRRDDYFDIQAKIRKEKDFVDRSNRPIVTSVFLNINNPNEIQGDMIGTGLERDVFLDSSSKIGDGAIIRNADTGAGIADEFIVFKANQIKSADPVTYDDAGNVIPLSERFNPEKNDIRWSKAAGNARYEYMFETGGVNSVGRQTTMAGSLGEAINNVRYHETKGRKFDTGSSWFRLKSFAGIPVGGKYGILYGGFENKGSKRVQDDDKRLKEMLNRQAVAGADSNGPVPGGHPSADQQRTDGAGGIAAGGVSGTGTADVGQGARSGDTAVPEDTGNNGTGSDNGSGYSGAGLTQGEFVWSKAVPEDVRDELMGISFERLSVFYDDVRVE